MKTYIKYRLNVGDNLRTIYKQKDINKIEIGCTNYNYNDAIEAIRLNYGNNSEYEDAINYLYNDDDNWEEVTNDIDYEALKAVVYNDYTTPETLDMLSFNENPVIRSGVADNPNTTPKTLNKLSDDECYDVIYALYRNLNTPGETLDKIKNNKEYEL